MVILKPRQPIAGKGHHQNRSGELKLLAAAAVGRRRVVLLVVPRREWQEEEGDKANFAKWEPWHGKFGLYHPWGKGKYLQIGEHLRELASSVLSLKYCLQSPRQPSSTMRQSINEPCEEVGLSLGWTLRELGESIKKMRKCHQENLILPKLKAIRQELSLVVSLSKVAQMENNVDALAIASFVFLLMEMVDKVEDLAKEVEELGENAAFRA